MGSGRQGKAKTVNGRLASANHGRGFQPVLGTCTGRAAHNVPGSSSTSAGIDTHRKSRQVLPVAKFTLSRFDWTKLETPKKSGLPMLTDLEHDGSSMHHNGTGDESNPDENGLQFLAAECATLLHANATETGSGTESEMTDGMGNGIGNEFIVPPPPPPQKSTNSSVQATAIDALPVDMAKEVIKIYSQQTNQTELPQKTWEKAHDLMFDAHVQSSLNNSAANGNTKSNNDDNVSIGSLGSLGSTFENWV